MDEEEGVGRSGGVEELEHEVLLFGPRVDEEEIDFVEGEVGFGVGERLVAAAAGTHEFVSALGLVGGETWGEVAAGDELGVQTGLAGQLAGEIDQPGLDLDAGGLEAEKGGEARADAQAAAPFQKAVAKGEIVFLDVGET